ncbi:MAG: class I SAM-dependent methyltransferase [Bacillota bacterium]
MTDKFTSRFFRQSDARTEKLVFPLPPYWWSRFYEYEWARRFCAPDDVVLDAGCGICHPFKFYLSDVCREVHACDIDPRILSAEEILKDIARDFGEEVSKRFPVKYFRQVFYCRASLTALPYPDRTFDKIYCISVLEHLPPAALFLSLQEFKRTLKDEGLIVLTFDYPLVNLEYLAKVFADVGLVFAGKVLFEMPENALYSEIDRLSCFRAVLRKAVNHRQRREDPDHHRKSLGFK